MFPISTGYQDYLHRQTLKRMRDEYYLPSEFPVDEKYIAYLITQEDNWFRVTKQL